MSVGGFVPRVLVEDVGVDVALVPHADGDVLVLRPRQSFESAVSQVCAVCPHLRPDVVRALVREAMPDAVDLPDLDELTGVPALGGDFRAPLRRRQALMVTGTVTAGLLVATGGLVAVVDGQAGALAKAVEAAPSSGLTRSEANDSAYRTAQFASWTDTGTMLCTPSGVLSARCTDEDGLVMASEAAIGPAWAVYTFSYGRDRIVLRIFEDPAGAEQFANEVGGNATNPNLTVVNRFVLWGTDAPRIKTYAESILQANSGRDALDALETSTAYSLSPRLGRLVAGTAVPDPTNTNDQHRRDLLERVVVGSTADATPVAYRSKVPFPGRVTPSAGRHVATAGSSAAPAVTSPAPSSAPPTTPAPTATPAASARPATPAAAMVPTATPTPTVLPSTEPESDRAGISAPPPDATTDPNDGMALEELVEELADGEGAPPVATPLLHNQVTSP